jgi:hypothetical protein
MERTADVDAVPGGGSVWDMREQAPHSVDIPGKRLCGEELQTQPCPGGVFMTLPGVRGAPETPFAG